MSARMEPVAVPGRAELLADLRERVFAPASAPDAADRIGAEVELIPLRADTGAPVPLQALPGCDAPALLPLLLRHARERGWEAEPTPYGAPRFRIPQGGCIFFEPGGQVEYSTPPLASASELLQRIRAVMLPLLAAARAEGIELLAAGIDPFNPLERTPLQLGGERYARMAAYLSRGGPAGGRMMRQTAAFQLNLDFGAEPELRWRVLNAAAPYLLAIFANSAIYQGLPTGHCSFRAHCWRELDPARTGILSCTGDPAEEYLDFALGAPPMLRCPPESEEHPPFGEYLARGQASSDDWHAHLTTLFPEVRPKGYLELRSLDAVAPEWWAAPLALVGGLLYEPRSLRSAAELLGAPDAGLLRGAGETGLADPRIGPVARDLFQIGLDGAAALGEAFIESTDLQAAREFCLRFTRLERSPAETPGPLLPERSESAAEFLA